MRKHYSREDLGKGVRGKFLKDYQSGTNLVLLRPEVAAAFPTPGALNDALMGLLKVEASARITSRATRTRTRVRAD